MTGGNTYIPAAKKSRRRFKRSNLRGANKSPSTEKAAFILNGKKITKASDSPVVNKVIPQIVEEEVPISQNEPSSVKQDPEEAPKVNVIASN